jgi:glycine cleavage system H protein
MIDPKTLKYAASHEWVKLDGDIATVGISKFAVDQLTDLILIDLPAVGKQVTPGKSFGEVESVKAVSDIYAPVGGEIIEVNPAVVADVQVLAKDPYTEGWLVKIKTSGGDLSGLLDYAAYEAKIADETH